MSKAELKTIAFKDIALKISKITIAG